MTETDFQTSTAEKLSLAQFINTALITLLANYTINKDGRWGSGGLLVDIFMVVVLQSFMNPFLQFFDLTYLLKKLKICKLESLASNDPENTVTQNEANLAFQGPEVSLYSKYSSIITLLWLAGLYSSLLPGLLIITTVGLFFTYWNEKV